MITKYTQRGLMITAALLTAACNQPAPIVSAPPPEWTQPVPEPEVPAEATDESVADYIVRLIDALRASNNKLKRLDDWVAGLPENK